MCENAPECVLTGVVCVERQLIRWLTCRSQNRRRQSHPLQTNASAFVLRPQFMTLSTPYVYVIFLLQHTCHQFAGGGGSQPRPHALRSKAPRRASQPASYCTCSCCSCLPIHSILGPTLKSVRFREGSVSIAGERRVLSQLRGSLLSIVGGGWGGAETDPTG